MHGRPHLPSSISCLEPSMNIERLVAGTVSREKCTERRQFLLAAEE